MRPVNLIPKEERPGAKRPLRGGPTAYVLVGALVAALLGLTSLVSTGNEISDLEAEITQTEADIAATEAEAAALDPYVQFHLVQEQRRETISSLADSRFDWERVMRELALILPDDVQLTTLTASASPESTPDGGTSVALRSAIAGPALSLNGCARDQDAVAGFIQALKDIDGVTRVGVQSSTMGGTDGASSASGSGGGSCTIPAFEAEYQMVVAFDAAPVPPSPTEAAPEAAPAEATETSTSSEEGEG